MVLLICSCSKSLFFYDKKTCLIARAASSQLCINNIFFFLVVLRSVSRAISKQAYLFSLFFSMSPRYLQISVCTSLALKISEWAFKCKFSFMKLVWQCCLYRTGVGWQCTGSRGRAGHHRTGQLRYRSSCNCELHPLWSTLQDAYSLLMGHCLVQGLPING